jgi:alpha-beta hydrolase superfamily lysophospholipase
MRRHRPWPALPVLTLLAAVLLAPPPARAADIVRFQVWTEDSLALYGGYFRAPAARTPRPIALLLHDRGQTGGDLVGLAESLQALGASVFLPDLRGEGRSRLARAGPVPPAASWDATARARLARDLEAVLAFADGQPELGGRPWLLAAEGEACALALELMAGAGGARYTAALLLSPLPAPDLAPAAANPRQRLFLVACDQDEASLAAVRALYGTDAGATRRLELAPCRSRGARLLAASPDLPARFLRWLAP